MSTRAEVAAVASDGMREIEADLTAAGLLVVLWRIRAHLWGDTPLPDGTVEVDSRG